MRIPVWDCPHCNAKISGYTICQKCWIPWRPTLDEYQEAALSVAFYPQMGRNPIYPALGIAGEAGEVCEKVKKVLRDEGGIFDSADAAAIGQELVDVLWYITAMARELGLSLHDIAVMNLAKLERRSRQGTLSGSGDDR